MASAVFLVLMRGRALPRGREDWVRMALVGTLGYALPLAMGSYGQAFSTATNAALLVGVEPVSIVLLSAFLLGERLDRRKLLAIVSGLAGAWLIVSQGMPAASVPDSETFRGDAILFAHGFCWALYSIIGKPALARVDPIVFTGVTTFFALAGLSPAATSLGAPPLWGAAAVAAVFLGLFVTVAGTLLWNQGLASIPASRVAPLVFLQPLTGVGLGVAWGGESLTAWTAAGGLLIMAGVYGAAVEVQQPQAAPGARVRLS